MAKRRSSRQATAEAIAASQADEVDNTMRTYLFYDAVKIDGPKKKILEFNEAGKFMDEKDLEIFGELCEGVREVEIGSGRYGLWGHIRKTTASATHLDRILQFVVERRRRCTRCRQTRSWYEAEDVLKLYPQVRDGGPMTVSEMYLAACAHEPRDEKFQCDSDVCQNVDVEHVTQSRMIGVPNVLVVQIARQDGKRIPVAVDEQLDLHGVGSMHLIGVVYHNG